MIWRIINAVARFIIELFALPPIPPQVPQLDINAPCPACGHRRGKLKSGQKDGKLQVQHDCLVCGAQWWEDPVLKQMEPIAATSATVKVDAPPATAPAKE